MIYDIAAAVDSYHDHDYEDQQDHINFMTTRFTCKTDGCNEQSDWHSEYCMNCMQRHAITDAVSALVCTRGTELEGYTRQLIEKHFPPIKKEAA